MTIGIYSAWAKDRRLQYFYRHTEIAESGFDFHGSPLKILFGRAIALLGGYLSSHPSTDERMRHLRSFGDGN